MPDDRKFQPPTSLGKQCFLEIVQRLAIQEGLQQTKIPSLSFLRASTTSEPLPAQYEPSIYVIAQGTKIVTLGDKNYIYNSDNYLTASVRLPITGQIIEASPDKPYLCVKLRFSADQIAEIVRDTPQLPVASSRLNSGLSVCKTSAELLSAMTRLVSLLETPQDIPFLAPLIIREILYRILHDENSQLILQLALGSERAVSISKAITIINQDYAEPLKINELAKSINLSPSALHHQFKRVTAMSPLQYQKKIRLQEARRLLFAESLEAAEVGYQVGYESPSQFSREYAKMFGLPPIRDVKRLRESVGTM
ncbi:AraC family transcriptional regulator [Paenibacillus sp. MER 99-2]|uniref:AraC family transcriptional regulator n=1 Tax=Paenibacillus sp. MER 99-2 TaxID=2939572 RepID=UPI00203C0671|nr:AraC family transcriptional regulator [Paenibacillus sp. MER 99-2]MCM3172290.1 AraC family transcriptional regulator [Paenibacillus sp. MER 99-2]